MTRYVTNDVLRRKLGAWFRRVEDGETVVVVDRVRRRARVKITTVDLEVDVGKLEREGRIDEEIYL